ncbi:MAG: hypothetical protein WDO12_11170 [Pseudomonadota bacterium]
MKKLIVAAALATAAVAGPALAGIGISLDIGAPGFYGQIDIGGFHPRTLYDRPVIVQQGYASQPPVYLRVPVGQDRNWRYYCGRYNACDRPVYFVRDDWYRNDYAPRYRYEHSYGRYDGRDGRWDNRRDDRRDNRRDYGNDRRDDRYGHGRDRGEDHRNDGPGRNDGHDQGGRPGNGRNDRDDHRDDNNGRR